MTEEEFEVVRAELDAELNSVSEYGHIMMWNKDAVQLDGEFTIEELQKIIDAMVNYLYIQF